MRQVAFRLSMLFCLLALVLAAPAQQLQYPVSMSANSGSLNGGKDSWGRPAPDSRAWTDPALDHNKLLQQQSGDGTYKLIGNYKVIGSSFLYGEHHQGDMYSSEAKALNIYVSYNTYNQDVEFYSTANPNQALVREVGTLDSFTIHADPAYGISTPMLFVYGNHIGAKDKSYYLELFAGPTYSLYKRYKSDLNYVSSNLGQSDLRQFDLQYDYFYADNQTHTVKKIKANAPAVIKEFKNVKDLSASIADDDYTMNPEGSLKKAFMLLNN